MKNISNSVGRWIRIACIVGSVLAVVPIQNAMAQYIFIDRFDTDTVGTFPSTWTADTIGSSARIYVTNNIPGVPSSPNSFQVSNLSTNEHFAMHRSFSTYSLNTVSQLVVNYSVNVTTIPQDGSLGFSIMPANSTAGEETFAALRAYKGSAANTWALQNYYDGLVANNLSLSNWYKLRIEIDPSSTNAQNGVVRWYLNDSFVHTENFIVPSITRTNLDSFIVRDTFPTFIPHSVTTFHLDNVYLFAEIPEPSALTLMVPAALLLGWLRRSRS